MPFRLSIVTPERPVVDLEVDSVVVPGGEGEFGVLPSHEPFLAPVAAGVVFYVTSEGEQRVATSGGFAEVTQEHVTLLARTAELADEIDADRAEAARTRAEEGLRAAEPTTPPDQLAILQAEAARAVARLRTLGR
jgi:F-type H+-transporting ATPase subunit epsilon